MKEDKLKPNRMQILIQINTMDWKLLCKDLIKIKLPTLQIQFKYKTTFTSCEGATNLNANMNANR